jgi:hypothetical protein
MVYVFLARIPGYTGGAGSLAGKLVYHFLPISARI